MKKISFFALSMPIILVIFFLIFNGSKFNLKKYEVSKSEQIQIEYFIKDYLYKYNQSIENGDLSYLKDYLKNNVATYKDLNEKILFSEGKENRYKKVLNIQTPKIIRIIKEDNSFNVAVSITYQIINTSYGYSILQYGQYKNEYMELTIVKNNKKNNSQLFLIDKFENKQLL